MALKIGTLEADITADTSGLKQAEAAVRKTGQTVEKTFDRAGREVQRDMDQMARSTRRGFQGMQRGAEDTARSMNRMRGAAGQLGFQVQDIAVQLQSGTNAMRVFTQQGSQIASIFGPGGAIVGAVLAVGGAIAGALIPALGESKDATEELEDSLEELDKVATRTADEGLFILTERIVDLARVSENAARAEIRGGIIAALEAMDQAVSGARDSINSALPAIGGFSGPIGMLEGMTRAAAESLGLTTKELEDLQTAFARFQADATPETFQALQDLLDRLSSGGASPALVRLTNDVRVFSASYADAVDKTQQLENVLKDLDAGLAETARRTDESREKTDRFAEAMRRAADRRLKQLSLLGETELEAIARQEQERRDFILSQTELTEEARAELLDKVAEDRIRQEEEIQERIRAVEERAAAEAERAAEQQAQAQTQIRQTALNSLVQLGDQATRALEAAGQEAGAVAKAIFLAQKAIQVASILAATEVAAANAAAVAASGGPVPFFATQAAVRATGYASAALVAGMAVGETLGGGRRFGGTVSASLAHPINEAGIPEILNQGGRQYLLPTGQGGTITPIGNSAPGVGQANVTIISNGTPQTVEATNITADEVTVMINDAARRVEDGIATSLATGRGRAARGLQRGFTVERNLR